MYFPTHNLRSFCSLLLSVSSRKLRLDRHTSLHIRIYIYINMYIKYIPMYIKTNDDDGNGNGKKGKIPNIHMYTHRLPTLNNPSRTSSTRWFLLTPSPRHCIYVLFLTRFRERLRHTHYTSSRSGGRHRRPIAFSCLRARVRSCVCAWVCVWVCACMCVCARVSDVKKIDVLLFEAAAAVEQQGPCCVAAAAVTKYYYVRIPAPIPVMTRARPMSRRGGIRMRSRRDLCAYNDGNLSAAAACGLVRDRSPPPS